jgi:catechol 2,3-dioxygenase-like lactoylglutathione lyase family enzyme
MAALSCAALAEEQLPVTALLGARFHVNDPAKAREFYGKVFGFQEKSPAGRGLVAFQINGEQYLEFSAGESGGSADPLAIIVFGTSKKPSAPLKDQDGRRVEFVESAAGAPSFKASEKSVSDHLLHLGIGTTDLNGAIDFYAGHFGCKEIWRGPTPAEFRIVIMRVPGPREEFVEFLLRGQPGSPDHICLDVPDIQRAYQTLVDRGAATRGKPRIASNGHWVLNVVDPNGLRVELMEPRPAAK